MHQTLGRRFTAATLAIAVIVGLGQSASKGETCKVTLDPPANGSITLDRHLPADGMVEKGTVLTVTATPDAEYAFDGGYYSTPGRWGTMYYESMTPTFKVPVDQDKHIGASFIKASELAGFEVIQDVVC